MGAGDDIPTVLRQVGLDVTLLTPDDVEHGDLSRFGTIVLGIRAYDTRDDVKKNNQRLLDYVHNGGTLLVQYNTSPGDFNAGHYTPYPAQLSRERVTVEEAPVTILDPQSPVFHYPNQITAHDFDGWVQERGLYFMDSWDTHYTPLLASQRSRRAAAKGRPAAGAVRQGPLHLHRLRVLPPVAVRRAGRDSPVCESAERGA